MTRKVSFAVLFAVVFAVGAPALFAQDAASAAADNNMFIAIELATAIPMYGPETATALLEANGWAQRFVPGLPWCAERAANARSLPKRRTARTLEAGLSPLAPQLDRAALGAFDRFWNRKYAWLDQAERDQRFKRRPEIATNHLNDHQQRVLTAWEARLREHGVPPP